MSGEPGLYAGPVIDAHIHLWSLAGNHYPWLAPGGRLGRAGHFDTLKHDYLPADYRRDSAGENVVASVHVEALWDPEGDPVGETRWLEGLDHGDGLAARYVAAAPFGVERTEQLLRRQAAYDRVVGIRQVIAWHPDPSRSMVATPELTRQPRWRTALPLLVELGLLLELLIHPWQAEEVAELAEAHPELTVVVDHVAGPVDQTPGGLNRWRAGLARLAGAPNVVIKVSSVQGYLPEPTQAATAEVVQTVVAAFGVDRVMIASDLPVGGMELSFAEVFRQYRVSVAHLDPREQQALFCGTAARVYAIPLKHLSP